MIRSDKILFFSSLVAIVLLGTVSWGIQNKIKTAAQLELGQSLSTVLDTSHQAIKSWLKEHQTATMIWANTPEVRQLTEELLALLPTREALIAAPAQTQLRAWLGPVHTGKGYQGYFIIGPDNINLASDRNQNIGAKSLLAKQGTLLDKIWSGETAVSLPHKSSVLLPDSEGNPRENSPTMFVGAPVLDTSGLVIAVFTFRIDPTEDFTTLLQQGRVGLTGETYAFDATGRLISNSRFDEQLRDIGLVSPDERGILNVELRDPGVNLVTGQRSRIPKAQRPLTRMAERAIAGESGFDLDGYRDYRGVPVIGAWVWDHDLGFGITTEIDTNEAYETLRATRYAISAFTILSIVLLMGLTVIFIVNRRHMLGGEKRLRQIIDLVPSMISVKDRDGRFQLVNQAVADAYGTTVEKLISADPKEVHGATVQTSLADDRKVMENGRIKLIPEETFLDARGNRHVLQTVKVPYVNGSSEQRTVLSVSTDITEHKQSEQALRESEIFNRAVLRSLSGHIAVLDRAGTIQAVNEAWERFARENGDPNGIRTGLGRNYLEVCRTAKGDTAEEARQALAGIESVLKGNCSLFTLEYACHSPEKKRWFRLYATPLSDETPGAVVSHIDITERKLAEEQARQRQAELAHVARLATMGEMATGIAHELNQPLAAITTYTDVSLRIIRSGLKRPEKLIETLERSRAQALRAGEIIHRVRQFVSKRSPRKENFDLNKLVHEVVGFIEAEARNQSVQVLLELDEQLPRVSADSIQIEQVLLNLMRNGIEAMQLAESDSRKLTVRTKLDGDRTILLAVADSGPGLDAEMLTRIFEPFTTTKVNGMGMGLSISRSIVEAHGGRLWAESKPGQGATFFFTLPA